MHTCTCASTSTGYHPGSRHCCKTCRARRRETEKREHTVHVPTNSSKHRTHTWEPLTGTYLDSTTSHTPEGQFRPLSVRHCATHRWRQTGFPRRTLEKQKWEGVLHFHRFPWTLMCNSQWRRWNLHPERVLSSIHSYKQYEYTPFAQKHEVRYYDRTFFPELQVIPRSLWKCLESWLPWTQLRAFKINVRLSFAYRIKF